MDPRCPWWIAPYAALLAILLGACGASRDAAEQDAATVLPAAPDADASAQLPRYTDPQTCAGCHPSHVREWSISPHAYAMVDPVFHAMVRLGQADTEGELDQFCTQCHAPAAVAQGKTAVYFDEASGTHRQHTQDLDPIAAAGVSCDVCHTMVEVHTTRNGEFTMLADQVFRAGIRDPVSNTFHESSYGELQVDRKSEICGTCHNVSRNGVDLEETYREWVASGFNGSRSCQDCHMPSYDGQAAPGGPERTLHRHTFVGVDVSLLPEEEFPGYHEMRELVQELLESAARIEPSLDAAARRLDLRIDNLAGHALPSGAVADREMWVELVVQDADGEVALASGTLDAGGDLRDDEPSHTLEPGSDPQLAVFRQAMWWDPALADPPEQGPPQRVHFLWEPNRVENHLIPPGNPLRPGSRTVSYDLSELPDGSYQASIRLLFRSFPPYLLRTLETKAGLDPAVRERLPIMEMASAALAFDL